MSDNKLKRSKSNAVIAGVCSGLAKYFGWDAGRVRLVYVLLSILSAGFPGTLVYIVLWVVMPSD
ncbi:MAG TPA: PspC domain-containing protein [Fulvivirga sp.]|nr:PspC domain-containing protein [Fulvivirga sp.]